MTLSRLSAWKWPIDRYLGPGTRRPAEYRIANQANLLDRTRHRLPRLLELTEREERPSQEAADQDRRNTRPTETSHVKFVGQVFDELRVQIRRLT